MHVSPELASKSIPRLLQVVHSLYPQSKGAVETFAWECARALGGTVLVLEPAAENFPEWEGLDVRCAEAGESAQWALNRVVGECAPEVVLVQHLGGHSPRMLMGLRERDIPYVLYLHDYHAICPTERLWHSSGDPCTGPGRGGLKCAMCITGSLRRVGEVPLRAVLLRHRPHDWQTALARADALVASSRTLRDFWIEQGAPPERMAVIAPLAPHDEAAAEDGPRAAGRRPVALYTGGWDEASGASFLLAAADELSDDWEFAFTGEMGEAARQQLREELDERHSARFALATSAEEMRQRMRAADVVVEPPRWSAPWSAAVAGALEAGRPVVATAVGGMAERIIHGVNGFLASAEEPASLAQSMEEALAAPWNAAETRAHAAAEARDALARLRRLLTLSAAATQRPGAPARALPTRDVPAVGAGAGTASVRGSAWDEPALELEYGEFLAQAATVFELSPEQARQRLAKAMREFSPWIDTVEDRAFALAVEMLTRRRRVYLNHAVAVFRAAGCRQVLDLHAGLGDAARWFAAWGMTARLEEGEPRLVHLAELMGARRAEEEFTPDGVFVNFGARDDDPLLLHRRFPRAHVIAVETQEGVEVV